MPQGDHGSDDCLVLLWLYCSCLCCFRCWTRPLAPSFVPPFARLFVNAFTAVAPSRRDVPLTRRSTGAYRDLPRSFPLPDASIMAFVLPTGAVGTSSITGTRVAAPAVCANATIAMRAAGDAPATRRAVLAGALAAAGLAILPGSASAKGGEGAKQSFFGAGAISNPFTYNEKSKGPVVYKVRTNMQRGQGGGLGCPCVGRISGRCRRSVRCWTYVLVCFVIGIGPCSARAWYDLLTVLCSGLLFCTPTCCVS